VSNYNLLNVLGKINKQYLEICNEEIPTGISIQPVIEYWNNIYPMPQELVADINKLVKVKIYKKGEILLVPGEIANYACFILKGLVKSYYTRQDDVTEVITKFLFEKSIVTSIFSFYSRTPGNEYIVALEETSVACLHYDDMQFLLKKHLTYNYIIRVITEHYLYFSEIELYNIRKPLAEDKYIFFVKHYPNLLQRLTLKDIASYLGMSMETLSRVRGKYRNNKKNIK
jgi:CRP/FNR family transcriptional regulator, anaerobic regulatory protein